MPVATAATRPDVLASVLDRADAGGFDVVGMRIVFPSAAQLHDLAPAPPAPAGTAGASTASSPEPVLVFALRRPHAVALWQSIMGASDPIIARQTDPGSVRAVHSTSKEDRLLACTRLASHANRQLATWFGRQFVTATAATAADDTTAVTATATITALPRRRGLSLLSTYAVDCNYFVVQAADSMHHLTCLLERCCDAGFVLQGCGRMSMTDARLSALGLARAPEAAAGAAGAAGTAVGGASTSTSTVTTTFVLKVAREHGAHHSLAVAATVAAELGVSVECVASLPVTSAISGALGDLDSLPTRELSDRRVARGCDFAGVSNTEHPLPLMLCVMGGAIKHVGSVIRQLSAAAGMQVLGTKWLPRLSSIHAKEVTPFEVGDAGYRPSVAQLSQRPVCFVAVFGTTLREQVEAIFAGHASADVSGAAKAGNLLLPLTAQSSWRQMAIFMHERDLVFGAEAHTLQLPVPDISKGKIYALGQHPPTITTAAALSGGLSLKEVSRVMDRIQREHFEIAALELQPASVEQTQASRGGAAGKPRWMFALRRANAVRCWLDTLDGAAETIGAGGNGAGSAAAVVDPFSLRHMIKDGSAAAAGQTLHGSATYADAEAELAMLFPAHTRPAPDGDQSTAVAAVAGSDKRGGRGGAGGMTYAVGAGAMNWSQEADPADPAGFALIAAPFPAGNALMETTCLVVGPKSASGITRERLYTQVFSIAAAKGFACIGARMLHMAPQRAQAYVQQSGRPKITVRKLVPGPLLVLALQRDNAVSCTDMLLCSRGDRDSLHAEMGVSIFAPASKPAAKADLAFFFADGV